MTGLRKKLSLNSATAPILILFFVLGFASLAYAAPLFRLLSNKINPPARTDYAGKDQKLIALTFDDGPYGDATVKILDILKDKNIKATFFVIGKKSQKYPEILRREVKEGHTIGNHSFSHSRSLATATPRKLKDDVFAADSSIFSAVGLHPKFFRPPYGFKSHEMVRVLKSAGYVVVMWDDAPKDYDVDQSPEAIDAAVIKKLKPGVIIDLHDGRDTHINYPRDNLIKALPHIIDKIRSLGYVPVTLDHLLRQNPYMISQY